MRQFLKGGQALLVRRADGNKVPVLVINSITGRTLICRLSPVQPPKYHAIVIKELGWETASPQTRALDWYIDLLTLEMVVEMAVIFEIGRLTRAKFYEVLRGLDQILFGALNWRRRRRPGDCF